MSNPYPAEAPDSRPARCPCGRPSSGVTQRVAQLTVLHDCLHNGALETLFQPILDLRMGRVIGYEALSRGPAGSALEQAASLFAYARECGYANDLELAAVRRAVERFGLSGRSGRLFVNLSPLALAERPEDVDIIVDCARRAGMPVRDIVIELSEHQSLDTASGAWEALLQRRSLGFGIAIDDLGEGFASLRLWSELHPEYVKLDKHFVRGIHCDPLKLQIARAVRQIAEVAGSTVIAEGVESAEDFQVVRDLGISLCQGYLIGRPVAEPEDAEALALCRRAASERVLVFPAQGRGVSRTSACKLARRVEPVAPEATNETVYARFEADPGLHALPVVAAGRPVGLITRASMIDRFARPYRRELYGRRPCAAFMNPRPAIVEGDASVQEIGLRVSDGEHGMLYEGFIVAENGRYLGIGTSHELMREITEQQILAARYANPLTLLPGNVPVAEHVERLLAAGLRFAMCYADLDEFKPYNDTFGYPLGDEMIQLVARTLAEVCDPRIDFLGHIGGDDFVVALQSPDWEARCRRALGLFGERVDAFFAPEHVSCGGFSAEDRRRETRFFGITSLSIGVVPVEPGTFGSHAELAAAAADAKRLAKREPGNSLFVERRSYRAVPPRRPAVER